MKILILLLSITLLTGCEKYDEYTPPEEVKFSVNEREYPVYGDEGNIYELIGDNNVKIKTNNKKLNVETIGEHTVTVEYEFNKKIYKKDLTYKVIDDVAPVFISAPSIRNVKINEDFYPCEEIVFGDNYERYPECRIEGNIDLTKLGTYEYQYIISDSSGNEATKKAKVNIVESISNNPTTPNKTTLPIEKVIEEKKNENTMIGIDVSRWQTNIDFEAVKNAGVEFVIMRFGINSDIDKDISVDSYFEQNMRNAKAAGLKVGVYCYSAATTVEKALEHAKWTVDNLNGMELDFPVAFDWENWSKFRKYEISIHDLNVVYETFSKYLKEHNYDSMLYSSKFYLENIWSNKINDKVWLAHYTNETNYAGDYMLWQMSNVGRVNGINGDVDIDILYKNKTDN